MEKLNLCELLKGHEGEIFYSPIYGTVKLDRIETNITYPIMCTQKGFNGYIYFSKDGKSYAHYEDGIVTIFPSKEQLDWNKWEEEQKPKTPKTWNEIRRCNAEVWQHISNMDYGPTEPSVKSALALLKIYQLIEVGYGGNITDEEWECSTQKKYCIRADTSKKSKIEKREFYDVKHHIAFHTEAQIDEFLSYTENVQLVKDFYQIQ